ncbi:hypothetical protein ACFFGV_18225 [Pontibacillus salicampi]|uniref:Cardiolipin synthase N-terminal domain-containing protein n=1 Tax=Pontibacillus salicampi TaxID=1449801 RepID=A0ABV6LSY9_9BACI
MKLLVAIFIFLFVLSIPIYLSVWAYNDAKQRNKGRAYPVIVCLMVLLLPFFGIFIYAVFRKK